MSENNPDLEQLLRAAADQWRAMSPEARRAMLAEQAASYARGEAAFGSDEDEREWREAHRSGDARRIAECERKERQRVAALNEILAPRQETAND